MNLFVTSFSCFSFLTLFQQHLNQSHLCLPSKSLSYCFAFSFLSSHYLFHLGHRHLYQILHLFRHHPPILEADFILGSPLYLQPRTRPYLLHPFQNHHPLPNLFHLIFSSPNLKTVARFDCQEFRLLHFMSWQVRMLLFWPLPKLEPDLFIPLKSPLFLLYSPPLPRELFLQCPLHHPFKEIFCSTL